MIDEGTTLIASALARGPAGPYQVQAAIAAIHDEAPHAEDTDWGQIVVLYETLEVIAPNPMVTLNRAVAVAMVRGPGAGLELLAPLEDDPRMAGHHRLHAVRAHLLERAGDTAAATAEYRMAARLTTSLPERRYLGAQAARLAGGRSRRVSRARPIAPARRARSRPSAASLLESAEHAPAVGMALERERATEPQITPRFDEPAAQVRAIGEACHRVSSEAGYTRGGQPCGRSPAAISFVPIARSVSCSPDVAAMIRASPRSAPSARRSSR